MKINFSFFPIRFFQLNLLLLFVFCLNSFSQNESKARNVSFETIAAVNDKNEIARPRVVEDAKNKDEKVESSKENTNTAILVTSASLINQLEKKAFEIINEKRKENGMPPIQWSEDMAKIARLHSENMAKFKFFSHEGRDGSMVNDRADLLGFSKWKAIGENIAYNRGYDNPVEFACQRWMQSQSHRENILSPRWKEAGVGIAVTAEGTYYFTQVFVLR